MTYDQNALRWTSANVLADVRRKASLPVSSADFTDEVLLREATDVLWSFAGWALAQAGEGRSLAFLNRSTVTGLLLYTSGSIRIGEVALPALAIADSISNVFWFDSTGQRQIRLAQIEAATEDGWGPVSEGDPQAYAVYEGRLKLFPIPTSGGAVRINYQRRHGELVTDTNALTVSAFSSNPSVFTFAPTTPPPLGLVPNDEIDLYAASSPHRLLFSGLNVVSTTSTTITANSPSATLPLTQGLPMVGARICRAGQTPYVSMPLELRAAVTEKIVANVLRIVGDLQGMQAAESAAKEELSRIIQLLSPRVKRDPKKAINPYSHLRTMVGRWRR